MPTCPSNCGNCCPEAPDITVNDVTIEVGDLVAKFYEDKNLTPVAGTNNTVQLSATPVAKDGVSWFVGGVHQNSDHVTLSGKTAVFDESIADKDVTAQYMGLADAADGVTDFETGFITYISTALSVPDGWLELDGSTPLIADYPALWAVLGVTHGGDGVTTFGLPAAASPSASFYGIIKT